MDAVKQRALVAPDLNLAQGLRVGAADAAMWVWFLATAYTSRLTDQLADVALFLPENAWFSIGACVVMSVALLGARWDRTPRAYRIACAAGGCASVGVLLVSSALGAANGPLATLAFTLFVTSYYASQVLRVEALSACEHLRTLLCALIVSFVGYYALSALLMVLPLWAYDAAMAALPLVFLSDGTAPAPVRSKDTPPLAGVIKSFAIAPTLFMLLFGIAGGLLTAAGQTVPAAGLGELFSRPSPVYLAMVLAYLALAVLAAQGHRLRRATYFAVINVVWMLGTLLGAWVIALLPGVPTGLFALFAALIALAIVASFVVFRNLWLQGREAPEPSMGANVQHVAGDFGVTARETEVLRLLADGRSLPYVQQKLCISEGTARTHIKHIYVKLGVHSKQELIDLVRGE